MFRMAQCLDEVYHCSPSYFHRLPSEVLLHIFECAVHSDLDPWDFVIPSRTTAPLALTQVCSSWRRLAISYQKLWTSISLVSRGARSHVLNEAILDLFIRRSGETLPFSFALHYDHPLEPSRACKLSVDNLDNTQYVDSVNALASRLAKVRHRWRRLVINVLVLDALEPFFRTSARDEKAGLEMPMLEEFSISTKYTDFYGPRLMLPLRSCSRLRTTRVLTPAVFFDPNRPRLDQLTTLDLYFCRSQQEALTWLSCCPDLESLSINFFASTNGDRIATSSERRIRLSRLTYFSLTCFYGELGTETMLDSLDLPSLSTFCFNRCGLVITSQRDGAWQSTIDLLSGRSQEPSPLQELRLVNAPSASAELKELLRRVGGSVRHLALGGDVCNDELLEEFHTGTAELKSGPEVDLNMKMPEPLCPELEALELLDVDVSLSSIISLASSRAAINSPPNSDSPSPRVVDSCMEAETHLRTLKRLSLSRDNFSRHLSQQDSDSSSLSPLESYFPEELEVALV